MFWVDKWLILRFYRLPKNYDKQPIDRILYLLKFTILFNFFWGMLFLSNDNIFTNNKMYINEVKKVNKFIDDNLSFLPLRVNERFSSQHICIFFFSEVALILVLVFE